ncbi:hypothetical protein [Paraburkholderia ginsengisoli]|uniref:Uncharacterized protein n=1 Tax=Paraburkholderia ginsengisoli TaxID=311231 RepID=A0A7T4N0W7_9BURK|nr:hypothetical protein [Paraburkholderia ginsengisoli]QQC63191.1 hypothetical protein I6I06_12860 [Paraburkholderia ginsengisoli]
MAEPARLKPGFDFSCGVAGKGVTGRLPGSRYQQPSNPHIRDIRAKKRALESFPRPRRLFLAYAPPGRALAELRSRQQKYFKGGVNKTFQWQSGLEVVTHRTRRPSDRKILE